MNSGYMMIIASMLLWGSIGIFVRKINQPPEVIVFFRVFITFLSMLLIRRHMKTRVHGKDYKGRLMLLILGGAFLSLNWMFFFKAIKTTSVASATLSYYTAPVFVTILSVFLLKERLNTKTGMAIVLSFAGIYMMLFNTDAIEGLKTQGIMFGLIAAIFYAMVTITAKKLETVSSYTIILFQTGVASILFMPSLRFLERIDGTSIVLMMIVGLVHTSIALTLYFEGIKRIKVQHVGILSYIDPLSAVIFALIFLGEIPNVYTIMGGVMILVATYLVLRKKKIRYRRK